MTGNPSHMGGRSIASFIGILVFLADFATKWWIANTLPLIYASSPHYPYGGVAVFQNFLGIEFSITHMTNRGAAWGILAEYQNHLLIARLLLVAGLILYFIFSNKHPAWQIPLALIIAGAAGNILDFFIYGHVVDMFRFILWGYDYPVFNVADIAIFMGIASLLILSWQEKKTHESSS